MRAYALGGVLFSIAIVLAESVPRYSFNFVVSKLTINYLICCKV